MTLTLVLKKGQEKSPRNIHVKYERSITYHSNAMANVKVFADKQTDRPKTVCARSIDEWGSKMEEKETSTLFNPSPDDKLSD